MHSILINMTSQWHNEHSHLSHSRTCPAEQQQISNVMFVVCGSCERVPLFTPLFGTQTTWKPVTTQGLEVLSPTFVTWLLFFVFSYFVFSFGAAVSLSSSLYFYLHQGGHVVWLGLSVGLSFGLFVSRITENYRPDFH